MSFRNVQENTIEPRDTLSVPPNLVDKTISNTKWIRNPAWPALPSITASDEKIVGLYAVYPNSAFAAVQMGTSAGTYTVNWGDGTTTNYTNGVQANYTYDYNDPDLAGTDGPVTFTDAGDTVNRNNHGYPDGYPISFASITTTTGITADQIYYVVNATTNTFQLAATPGGAVLPLTNDGSGTILPYKIATVTITPTTGGATFSSIQFDRRNSSANTQYSTGWLDLAIAASVTSMSQIGGQNNVIGGNLEQVRILRHRVTAVSSWFTGCRKLANVVEITADTGINPTSYTAIFQDCTNLQTVPLFNTATCTALNNLFAGCRSLTTVPLFNTAACTNMSNMFSGCQNLTTIPLLNTAACTNMSNMFAFCQSLTTVPLLNTAACTNMTSMFSDCSSLTTVPLLNTAACTNMTTMFRNCYRLSTVPIFNTAACTNMTSMFNGCYSLVSVPLLNTAACTNMTSMFASCASLQTVPLLNTAAVTDMGTMFNGCSSLISVPLFNTINVTNMGGMFSNCSNLQTVPLFNTPALLFASTMFSNCTSLTSVPAFNTSLVVTMSGMFSSCSNLQQIPAFNSASQIPAQGMGFGTTMPSVSRILATNIFYTFSVSNYKLSGTALNEIYTNLPTVNAQGTAVTFQDAANTVTLNNHGYTNGRQVNFTTVVTTTGITAGTTYYARNVTTNTFQLSTSQTGGTIINLVNDGTGTLTGQVITVSGNWGTATDTPSIATAKGWAVTG